MVASSRRVTPRRVRVVRVVFWACVFALLAVLAFVLLAILGWLLVVDWGVLGL